MKIAFIHRGGPAMASYRYRVQIPAQELRKLGHEVSTEPPCEAEVVIFSKPCEDDVRLAREVKGKAIIGFDVCDPHFHLPHYQEMRELADFLVPSSQWQLNELANGSTWVSPFIPDPYEMEECAPHAENNSVLWFGHQANLPAQKYLNLCNRFVAGPKRIEGATHYSPENLKRALKDAGLAIFPVSQGQEYKTNNRVLNTIRSGVFPICEPHPAYKEFKDLIWTSDIHTGLRWARFVGPLHLNNLIRQAQNKIRDQYSPEAIGKRWESVLSYIWEQAIITGRAS